MTLASPPISFAPPKNPPTDASVSPIELQDPADVTSFHDRNRLRLFIAPFFFLYGAIGVIFPFYSLWLKDWGLSDAQNAAVVAVNGLAVIVWSQFWGYAGDMILPRKTLLMINALAAILFFSLMPWTRGFWMIVLVTFAFASFVTPNAQLLNSLLLSQEKGERRYSVIRSAGTVGFILINLFIGWMSQRHGTAVVFLFYGLTLVFFVVSIMPIRETPPWKRRGPTGGTTGAGITANSVGPLPESDGATRGSEAVLPPRPERVGFLEAQRVFWRRPAVRRFLIFVAVYQVSHAMSHQFQGIWIRQLGGDDRVVSYSYSLAAFAELFVFWTVDRILSTRSAAPFLLFAAVTQAGRWGLLFLVPELWVTVASNVLHAVTFGLFFAAGIVYIHRLSPPNLRTTGQTLFGLAYFGFAALASNLLGSLVIREGGLRAWYGVAGALGLVAAVLALRIPREDYP